MHNQINSPEASKPDAPKLKQLASQERLDRSAEQAAITEQRYDEGHQIFTK